MAYELFRRAIGGPTHDDNPFEEALIAAGSDRYAAGVVDISRPLEDGERLAGVVVRLSYNKDRERGEEYKLSVNLKGSSGVWNHYYDRRFDGEAVFEKLVRDYDLTENPAPDEVEAMNGRLEETFEEDAQDGGLLDRFRPDAE